MENIGLLVPGVRKWRHHEQVDMPAQCKVSHRGPHVFDGVEGDFYKSQKSGDKLTARQICEKLTQIISPLSGFGIRETPARTVPKIV